MNVKGETIKAIFTNLLFLIGVILIVVGFIRSTSTVVKFLVFNKYPLDTYLENSCEYPQYAKPMREDGTQPEITEEEKTKCLENLETERKLRMVDDVTTSVSFLVSGLAISLLFRRFIFGKKEK